MTAKIPLDWYNLPANVKIRQDELAEFVLSNSDVLDLYRKWYRDRLDKLAANTTGDLAGMGLKSAPTATG
jgi:hypothetical protein